MKLKNLFGTDIKESLKKIVFRYKNRNFVPYVVERTLLKTDFKFYVANLDGKTWYVDSSSSAGEWLWPEMEFVKNAICKPGDIVLECGGHHGLTAVVISKWIGNEGHLYTFEPNPDNVAIIKKNIEINGVKNATIIPNAVGAEDGTIMISHSSSNSYILKGKEHNGIEVAVVKADDYLHLKPTVIKIDVEGFETDVLKGATELLKTMPKLAIELHPDMMSRYGSSVEELLSLLSTDYNLWVQWEILKPPVPYDRKDPIPDRAHLFAIPK
ncbi:FkbM family methyltransferase [Mucilaginibacter sp.]|jgi:FkbM family methyltransferase|uniref:FkbM family methyltransferase n=1 Tax=Mucilaginibacter sp. TaxID=1882438 RepID=UPI003569A8C8